MLDIYDIIHSNSVPNLIWEQFLKVEFDMSTQNSKIKCLTMSAVAGVFI